MPNGTQIENGDVNGNGRSVYTELADKYEADIGALEKGLNFPFADVEWKTYDTRERGQIAFLFSLPPEDLSRLAEEFRNQKLVGWEGDFLKELEFLAGCTKKSAKFKNSLKIAKGE